MIWVGAVLALGILAGWVLLRRGERWGSTPSERAREMPGDDYLEGGPRVRVAMTRAVTSTAGGPSPGGSMECDSSAPGPAW